MPKRKRRSSTAAPRKEPDKPANEPAQTKRPAPAKDAAQTKRSAPAKDAAQTKRSAPAKEPTPATPPTSRRWGLVGASALLLGGSAIAVLAVGKKHETARPPSDAAVAVARIPDAGTPADAAPPPPPASTYIGSEQCGDCHEKEHKAWKTSWHAKALAPATPQFVVGNFANAHFTGSSSEAWMTRAGKTSVMRTHGVGGDLADFKVDYVIGGKRMQDDVTVFPDGRWQVLPVYFHVKDKTWVDYTEAKQGALTPEHPFYWTNARRMANHECLDCHTTGVKVEYDEATAKWNTSFIDGNVACENCHGAGSKHAETSKKADILKPEHGGVAVAACERCHGPRRPLFSLLDASHSFQLGQSYDEMYEPIVITMPDGGDSTDYFADGKPKTSSFEYQAMLQSRCYLQGKADCLTCHTAPHDAKHRKDELRDTPDALCATCHADIRAAGTAHSHHKSATCVDCHMAPIVTGVLDHFADHSIDIPVPQNTAKHAVPNACGVCHPKKTPDELQASIVGWFPDAPARQARRIQLADAFDPDTGKDSLHPLLGVIGDANETPTLRGAAMVTLARRLGPRAAKPIVPLLDDPDLVLRAKAAEALAAAKATGATDALAKHLGDPSMRVRLAVALALHDLHDPRGDEGLRKLADDPTSSSLVIPHLELAGNAMPQKDWKTAKTELLWVVKLWPFYADAIFQLAAVEHELGDDVAAKARVEQLLRLEPTHQGALGLKSVLKP